MNMLRKASPSNNRSSLILMKLDELIMVDPRENSRKTTYALNSKCRGVAADLPVSNQSGWSEVSMVSNHSKER